MAGFEPAASCSQSRRDNRATLHPEGKILSGETGTRTLATITRRQISNLLHYRSGTSPSSKNVSCFAVANLTHHTVSHNYFVDFFSGFLTLKQKHFTVKHIAKHINSKNVKKYNTEIKIKFYPKKFKFATLTNTKYQP